MGRIWMPGIEIIDYCEWFFLCRQMPPTPQISAAAAATMAVPPVMIRKSFTCSFIIIFLVLSIF